MISWIDGFVKVLRITFFFREKHLSATKMNAGVSVVLQSAGFLI
jgi:hypothetical protein